jgi:hypothetical protein
MHLFGRPELRVGVVGHRLNQLPEAARPRLATTISRLLGVIEEIGEQAGARRFAMISALAEGTDRYAADAALQRHWSLDAPLPFSVRRYERDFADKASVKEFRALMKAARTVTPHPQNDRDDDAGYGGVGAHIAAHCHLLIAVWNGAAAKGPGGTADVIARALAAGAPVLWLGVERSAPTLLLTPDKKAQRKDDLAKALVKYLSVRFESAARPAQLSVHA